MGALTCSETSVTNYQTLFEIQEGRRYLSTRGGSLKSRIFLWYFLIIMFRLHRKYSVEKIDFLFNSDVARIFKDTTGTNLRHNWNQFKVTIKELI